MVNPVALFTTSVAATPSCGTTAGLTCTDASVASPTKSINTWNWDFGDGTTHATTQNPTHSYAASGTYRVTLVVTDTGGGSGSYFSDIVIPAVVACADHAEFHALVKPAVCGVVRPVQFTDDTVIATGHTITARDWDFGDGSAHGTTANPLHQYAAAGTYTVVYTTTQTTVGATARSHDVVVPAVVACPVTALPPVPDVPASYTVVNPLLYPASGGDWTTMTSLKADANFGSGTLALVILPIPDGMTAAQFAATFPVSNLVWFLTSAGVPQSTIPAGVTGVALAMPVYYDAALQSYVMARYDEPQNADTFVASTLVGAATVAKAGATWAKLTDKQRIMVPTTPVV